MPRRFLPWIVRAVCANGSATESIRCFATNTSALHTARALAITRLPDLDQSAARLVHCWLPCATRAAIARLAPAQTAKLRYIAVARAQAATAVVGNVQRRVCEVGVTHPVPKDPKRGQSTILLWLQPTRLDGLLAADVPPRSR